MHDNFVCVPCNRKRRKAQPEKPPKRLRPETDNDQTRKLRSAQPEEPIVHSVPSMHNGLDHDTMQASNSAADLEEAELEDDEEQEIDSQPQGAHLFCCSLQWTRFAPHLHLP